MLPRFRLPPSWPAWLRQERWVVSLFFAGLLGLGLAVFRDYGMSWDEVNNHLNGLVSLNHVAQVLFPKVAARLAAQHSPLPPLATYPAGDHGPLFEMVASVVGYAVAGSDSRGMYLTRHLLVFSTFLLGVAGLYYLARWRFGHWGWGLLAALLLVLSPRFFAEAFYNGKDVVFMALLTLGAAGSLWASHRPSYRRALVLALLTAAATDVRVHGVLLLAPSLAALAAPTGRRPKLRLAATYLVVAGLATYAGWPYLWTQTLSELGQATQRLGHFPWPYRTLYWGQLLPATRLPWHYTPVWIALTTPVSYLGLAVAGLVALVRHRPVRQHRWFDAGVLLWALGPLALVMLTRPVQYDGWRHLYFLYPGLLLLAVGGGRALWHRARIPGPARRWAVIALALFVVELPVTAIRMIRLHPYQQAYFAWLPAEAAGRLFERDYWGLAYADGLRWALARQPQPRLTIRAPWGTPLYNNYLILTPQQRARLQFRGPGPSFYLTNYRWHPQSYQDSVGQAVHTIEAEGLPILTVFAPGPPAQP